jgi:predicted TIM-barrel fold metal-dependent hydrolase
MSLASSERSTPARITGRIRVIDVDTHITEPPDLWTSRLSTKWGDLVPHVDIRRYRGGDPHETWVLGGKPTLAVGVTSMAGWREHYPSHPPTFAEIADTGAWDAKARLERMDEYGIYAQVLYPNVGGFGAGEFTKLGEPDLMLDCVRAYNDYLTEWCSADPKRLAPVTALPFWDVDQAAAEIERCYKAGHKGVVFPAQVATFDLPHLVEPHWDPVWNMAQDLGLSINYHIGGGNRDFIPRGPRTMGLHANAAKRAAMLFLGNGEAIADTICGGLCHRFPRLNFVSVESGIGWVPFFLEALDWQWQNCGVGEEHPDFDLLPSEYFRRQMYSCFWFERDAGIDAITRLGPDNVLYETDFPHPTSMSPGPASVAVRPGDYIESTLGALPEEDLRKVLHDNAARLYHLD